MTAAVPRVVIIGAGVVGAAAADELTARGWTDVTVVDQGVLPRPGGSSSHAPGLVFQTNGSKTMATFATRTVEKLVGLDVFRSVGGLEIATTPERLADLQRRRGWATSWGIPARLVDPDECAALHPLLPATHVLGGLHTPTDGLADAPAAVVAQLAAAAARGARVLGEHRVTDILRAHGRVTGVRTDHGDLAADVVVCAAGFWGARIGALVDLPVPLLPLAHQYARTGPVAGLTGASPILRYQDRDLYFREHGDQIGIGSYAHRPMPADMDTLPALPAMPSVLPFTPDDFAPSFADAVALLPALGDAGIAEGFNGIFSFTTDGFPLLGEHPDLAGFWVAEAVWVTHSCGIAEALAKWLVDGEPGVDVHGCDLNRFDDVQRAPEIVRARSERSFIEVYDILHPLDPPGDLRPLRTSPFHPRHVELGAVFTETGGWERPRWFEANACLPEVARIPRRTGWAARHWSPIVGAEGLVTRDRVALYDMTPLRRLRVSGPGALDLLQRLTTNDVAKPVGAITYTLLLDGDGGVRSDLTVARLGEDEFQVGANSALDLHVLRRAAPPGTRVEDVTGATCGIGLWGPRARDVLSSVSRDDVSHARFGYFKARQIHVGPVPVTALRVSYVGELGWELYAPVELGLHLWDTLWDAGQRHGMIAAGRGAFDALRLEKGYRSSGVDMTTEHDPHESGLGFAVRPRVVAASPRIAGRPTRRIVPLVLDDPARAVLGHEPVFLDGVAAGYVTSAAYGPTLDASIAYAWLPASATVGTAVTIGWFDELLPAVVAAEPLFDPEGKRLRC